MNDCRFGVLAVNYPYPDSLFALDTVMFLSFRTDRSGQTVQTQIRLLRVYTVCNSLCIFWMHYSKGKQSCSTFRVITANFQVSEILGFLQYAPTENLMKSSKCTNIDQL